MTDDEIAAILAYVDCMYDGSCAPKAAVATEAPVDSGGGGGDNTFLFITLFIILALLALVLARIISNLNHMAEVKEGNVDAPRRSLVDILTSKGVIGFVLFCADCPGRLYNSQ